MRGRDRDPEPAAEMPDLGAAEGCGPYAPDSLLRCVDGARLERDLRFIAQPRPPGSEHHEAVKRRCADRLAELGFEVEMQGYGSGVNVIGRRPGFSRAREHVLVSAHYDHLEGCAGADDNASGVAVALELGRVASTATFDRTLVIACWDEAERGQLGSKAYAAAARERGDRIVTAIALEAVGYAKSDPDSQKIPERFEELFPDQALALVEHDHRANFLAVIAEASSEQSADAVARYGASVALRVHVLSLTEAVKAKQRAFDRSDHTSFWDVHYPAMLLTDSGDYRNPYFHCKAGEDGADTLDYRFLELVAQATVGMVAELLITR
jgi:Zn-dependent M28 family amino/carboxypeptidase